MHGGWLRNVLAIGKYLFKAAGLAIVLVSAVVIFLWVRDNWIVQHQLEEDSATAVIGVPSGSAINLNELVAAELVCLFPPDYPVVQRLSTLFEGYRLSRSSEVRAEWVLSGLHSKKRYIELSYLKGVRSHGNNLKGVPCGRRLLLENSRFHDMNDSNLIGFEFLLTHFGINCASSDQTLTAERMLSGGCQ